MKDIKNKIMYSPISAILTKLEEGKISHWDAHDEILSLMYGNRESVSSSMPESGVSHAVREWNADHPNDEGGSEDVAEAWSMKEFETIKYR